MKKTNRTSKWLSCATFIISLTLSSITNAQSCDVFNCNGIGAPWTQVNTGVSMSGTNILASSCGSGGVPKYVHATLPGGVLSNNWVCDFEFTPTGGTGPAHSLVSFTEGSVEAHGYWVAPGNFDYTYTHCIEAYILAPYGGAYPTWKLYAGSKVRPSGSPYGTYSAGPIPWSTSAGISLGSTLGVTFYARLQRLNAANGLISLYSDAARTVLIGSSCFAIDPGVTGLINVQSGTHNEGSTGRSYSGTVDNISVCELTPTIGGPTSICASGSGVFTMWNGNTGVTGGINGFPGSTGITWSGGSSYSPGSGGVSSTSAPGLHNECTITMTASGWLSCTINYPCGASVTYSMFVVVLPDPTSVITGPALFCAGAPINLSGASSTNETSYRWKAIETDAAGVPVAGALWCGYPTWTTGTAGPVNLSSILPCLFTCGKYYKARLETKNSCATASDEHIFFIACPPTISVTGPTSVCAGSCASLTASGAFSYVWSPSTGLSCTGCSNPSACPPSTQIYTVTGTSLMGCSGTTTYTLTVNPNPTVSLGPDMALCCNVTYTINPTVSGGTAPYTYSWTSTPPAATSMLHCSHGGTHPDLSCPAPMMLWTCPTPVPVTFIVTVTDANGCTATDAIDYTNTSCRLANSETGDQHVATIYPNPASKQITVSTVGIADQLFVTDAMGRTVLTIQPNAEQTQIDITGLSPGIYFVQIVTGESKQTERLVIEE